jgi:hypothetical protein
MTSSDSSRAPLRTPSDEEIPSLLDALASSGGTVAAFAQEQGLTPWKLYAARRVAAGKGSRRARRARDLAFVPVRVVEEGPAPSVPLELILGSGHRLLIPAGFDAPTLRRAIGVLASC